jgi:hypothetical protein
MKKENYTSLELSKWLKENGCKLKHGYEWNDGKLIKKGTRLYAGGGLVNKPPKTIYPAYDILNDLCVRYAKEMFGEKIVGEVDQYAWQWRTNMILISLQQRNKQKTEDYIKKHCLFNPNNHE